MKKNIFAIVAHADDEAIGCGGTLLKHQKQGDHISIVYMTNGVSAPKNSSDTDYEQRLRMTKKAGEYLSAKQYFFNFPDNEMDTVAILDVVQAIESVTKKELPDIIYTHHYGDLNIDHRIVHQAVMTAFRPIPLVKTPTIYSFEVNSSTEWNTPINAFAFSPTFFVDISEHIAEKQKLLLIYEDEMRKPPHSRSIDAIEALAKVRGNTVGVDYAEAFMLKRKVS